MRATNCSNYLALLATLLAGCHVNDQPTQDLSSETQNTSSSSTTTSSTNDSTSDASSDSLGSSDSTSETFEQLDKRTVEMLVYLGQADGVIPRVPLFLPLPAELQGEETAPLQASNSSRRMRQYAPTADVRVVSGEQSVLIRQSDWPKIGEIQVLSQPSADAPAELLATIGGETEAFCQFVAGDFNHDGYADLAVAHCREPTKPARFIPGSAAGLQLAAAFDLPTFDDYPYLDNLFAWQDKSQASPTDHLALAVASPHALEKDSIVDWNEAALAKQKYATLAFANDGTVSMVETDLGERGDLWFRPRPFGQTADGRTRLLTAFTPRDFTYLDVDDAGKFTEAGTVSLPEQMEDEDCTPAFVPWSIADGSVAVADLDGRDGNDIVSLRDYRSRGPCDHIHGSWASAKPDGTLKAFIEFSIFSPRGPIFVLPGSNAPDRLFVGSNGILAFDPDAPSDDALRSVGGWVSSPRNPYLSSYVFDYDADGIDDVAVIVDWSKRDLHPF